MFNITSNIEQVIERFKLIKGNLSGIDLSEALVVGVNAARGQMMFRIFNEGKDNKNQSLGIYVGKKEKLSTESFEKKVGKKKKEFLVGQLDEFSQYQIKRIKSGRQVKYKDLEFTGDLRRGIKTIKESNIRVVAAIPNDKLFQIAQGQEKQIGRILNNPEVKIFIPSEEELQLLRDNTNEALKQIYDRIFNT